VPLTQLWPSVDPGEDIVGPRRGVRVAAFGAALVLVAGVLVPSVAVAGVEEAASGDAGGAPTTVTPAAVQFRDVPAGAYYASGAEWLASEGISTGLAEDPSLFNPSGLVTRGQMAAFLWRFAGEPDANEACGFADVPTGKFFSAAACWLKAEGITTGFNGDETVFLPGGVVSRAQMATFLWRFAAEPATVEPCGFVDVAPGSWSAEASCWALASGVTTGLGGDARIYGPGGSVTRGQMAAFLDRLGSRPEAWQVEPPGRVRFRCEQLDPRACLLPFPSDHFTRADASTDTGRRLDLPRGSMPANKDGVRINPADQNRADGFSPGSALLFHAPTADLERSGAAPITDIGSSLDPDAAVVIINTTTGERHPHWVELSAQETNPADRVTYIRPAVNFAEATRYVVGIRNLVDGEGERVASSPAFASLRDGTPAPSAGVEARRQHLDDEVFAVLADAGVERADLFLAWDFTVASPQSLAGRLLTMRDETFDALGDATPTFTITPRNAAQCVGAAEQQACQNPYEAAGVRKIEGRITVPNYLQGTGASGTRFQNFDADGLPVRNPTTPNLQVPFWCAVPSTATPANKARLVLLGHGLFGTAAEIKTGDALDWVATEGNAVVCGVDLWGLTINDILTVGTQLQDLSAFRSIPDRGQQALLATLVLGRALKHPDGLGALPSFGNDGESALDTDQLYYVGLSMGGIMGGALMGVAQDFDRALLGVPGMNYSTMLERSALAGIALAVFRPSYPQAIDRPIALGLMQLLWDRSEANGYAHHITGDPFGAGGAALTEFGATPAKDLLVFMAYADEAVPNITTEVMARTMGIGVRDPVLRADRSPLADDPAVEPLWGIDRITDFPHDGSGMLVWDFLDEPVPTTNTPPPASGGPHGDGARLSSLRTLVFEYFQPDGAFVDVCGAGDPCFGRPDL
jgi:hypothetical protein